MRRVLLVLVVLLVLSTISCSNDEETPVGPGTPPDEGTVTATILPEGGTVSVQASGDVEVTLVFPEGAVLEPLKITLRPAEPIGEAMFGLALEPAGTVFYQLIDITAEFPTGTDLTAQHLIFGDPADLFILATGVDHDTKSLSASVAFFGLTDNFLDPAAKASSGANQLGTAPATCQQLISRLERRFNDYLTRKDFEEAAKFAHAIADTLLGNNCSNWQYWVDIWKQTACDGSVAAMADARAAPTTHYGDFFDQAKILIDWAGILEGLPDPVTCSADPMVTVGEEILDYEAFMANALDNLQAHDITTFLDIKFEARRVFTLMNRALTFGLFDAEEALRLKALHPALNLMRDTAYHMGMDDGWHYPLSRVTTQGFFAPRDIAGVDPRFSQTAPSDYFDFNNGDIHEDLQYCGTDLVLETVVASGGKLADGRVGTDGGPGLSTNDTRMEAPTRGKLRLSGELNGFSCWNDVPADDEIVFRMNNKDAYILPRPAGADDYLQGQPVEIDIAEMAQQAGMIPKGGFSTEITVYRRGSQCNEDVWGPSDYKLFTWTVVWQNPTLEVEVDLPSTVNAGETVDVDVRVKVIDQLDHAGFFDGIDLVLQSSGGTLEQLSGQTDSQGYFRTQFTADNKKLLMGDEQVKAGAIQIDATAMSFEGVSAQGSAIIAVGARAVLEATQRHGGLASAHTTNDNCFHTIDDIRNVDTVNINESISASASCLDAVANCEATISAVGDIDDSNSIRSLSANASSGASRAASGDGFALAHAGLATAWFFNVEGGQVEYHITGNTTGENNGVSSVTLLEMGPAPRNKPGLIVAELKGNGSIDKTGFLGPGRYKVSIGSKAIANGSRTSANGQTVGKFEILGNP